MRIHTGAEPSPKHEASRDRTVSWLFVAAGASGGLTLGIIARAWMRWISTDPEFSWAGTIAIVASFTVFGAAQSAAAVARIRVKRPAGIAVFRVLAVVLSVGLFGAAGALMFPTVLFGSLAVWRSDVPKFVRVVCGAIALPGAVFVLAGIGEDHGWGVTTIGQMVLFLLIYAVIVAATGPSAAPRANGWRPSQRQVLVSGGLLALLIGVALYFGGIQ